MDVKRATKKLDSCNETESKGRILMRATKHFTQAPPMFRQNYPPTHTYANTGLWCSLSLFLAACSIILQATQRNEKATIIGSNTRVQDWRRKSDGVLQLAGSCAYGAIIIIP